MKDYSHIDKHQINILGNRNMKMNRYWLLIFYKLIYKLIKLKLENSVVYKVGNAENMCLEYISLLS